MTETIDHVSEARRIVADGENAVGKLRDAHAHGDIAAANDYGKKAAGCWAQAQVHATLALVEQERLANLIALFTLSEDDSADYTTAGVSYPDIRNQIIEGLGL